MLSPTVDRLDRTKSLSASAEVVAAGSHSPGRKNLEKDAGGYLPVEVGGSKSGSKKRTNSGTISMNVKSKCLDFSD